MSADKQQYENDFDKMLKGALRTRSGHVPGEFADNVLRRAQVLDEQKILAKVILQERLALAMCITIALAAIAAVVAYSQTLPTAWTGLKSLFYGIAKQIALMPQYDGLFGIVTAGVIGFAVYSFFNLLFADR